MIFFLTQEADKDWGMGGFVAADGAARLGGRLRVLTYEDLVKRRELPVGSYIFAQLDQLSPTETDIVLRCYEALARAAPHATLLNHPADVLHRYELLQNAYEAGRNCFRVSRASEFDRVRRFPVFLRQERQHGGSLTPLLRSRWELDRALLMAWLRGHRLRDLLVVEYCDTSDDQGVFRKYGAYAIGDRIVPRSIIHSSHWVTKAARRVVSLETIEEERRYITENPHEQWIGETFAMARVGYGRMDYGFHEGKPQVWEINLAPTLSSPPSAPRNKARPEERRMRAAVRQVSNDLLMDALESIDVDEDPNRVLSIPISEQELLNLEREKRVLARLRSPKSIRARLARPAKRLLRLGSLSATTSG